MVGLAEALTRVLLPCKYKSYYLENQCCRSSLLTFALLDDPVLSGKVLLELSYLRGHSPGVQRLLIYCMYTICIDPLGSGHA